MTKAEFLEKHGDAIVTLSRYYKYTFTFSGTLPDEKRIIISVGGDANDIYREEFSCGEEQKVLDLYPYAGCILDNGGKEIESFFEL